MKQSHNRRILSKNIASILALSLGLGTSASAANVWDGGGGTNLWSELTNWDDDLFPGYGTLTFSGATQTTNVVDASISQNMLLWTGTSDWTLNNANGAVISLFDNGGAQAKVENQSSGLVTVNAPVTFAATSGAAWGEINAVNGGLTFGSAGALTVNGSIVAGIKMFGSGQTTTFNNTVSAVGKWFATTGASAATVEVGGAFTSGDIYAMNGSTLKLNSGGSITTSGLRLGGDFGTTLTQNLALGATFALTSATGGQSFGSNINSVTGNTSNALMVDSQNTSGTNTLSGNIFLDSPVKIQVAAGGTLAATGVISNGSSLTKQGDGTLTLSGVNTFGGGTTLAAGTLNLGNAAALGTGALTVSGNSTLDNTSGAAFTTAAAKALNLNADLTFTGTNNLNMNGGTIAIGGAAGQRTVNVVAGTMSTGLINSGAGIGLTKTGAGTLSNTATGVSNIGGLVDIQAGTLQTAGDINFNGGISGAGTLENGSAASKWIFITSPTDTTFSGTIRDNPNNAAVRLGLVKKGTGTLNLTGANNLTSDRFSIEDGKIRIAGTYTAGFAAGAANQTALVGSVANQNGVLHIDGGTFNATRNANPSLAIGSGANTRGFLSLTSGTLNSAQQVNIGNGSGAVGTRGFSAATVSGGTLNSGSWLVVSANFDRAVLNQSGGTINVNANRATIGAGGNEAHGIVNQTGGIFNVVAGGNTGIFLGENGRGIYNLSGGSVNLNTNGGATSGTMQFAGNASSLEAHFNLNGGTLTAFGVTKGASTAGGVYRFNYNGGTLRANANNAAFFADLANTTAYVNPGGAIVDTNSFNVTMSEPLLAPTGSGVSAIAVTAGGAGYIDTPHVTLSGGTGSGATAVANVSGGVVTGFTITNPGTGYGAADVLTATVFGGGATTAATVGAITLAANTSGGFTKNGAGTLTLTNRNTFTGASVINGGTVYANPGNAANNGSFSFTSGITVNSGAILQSGLNGLFGFDGTQTKPITVNAGGSLRTDAANTDVNVGIVNLNGGTIESGGASPAWGSFNFKRAAGGKINVTENSTVSALDVGLGATNSIDVAATKTLTFSGTINDLTSEGQMALVKNGSGAVNFSNTNAFTGATTINGGTVQLSGTGAMNATSGIAVNGSGAKFLQTSTVAVSPIVTLTNGTVDGTGTINTVNVADLATNLITNGNGTAGSQLTIGSLTFAGAGKINALLNGTTAGIVTTTLTANGAAGSVSIDASNLIWDNGSTYNLISYGGGTIGGTGSSAFIKGTITGLGARQSATLIDTSSALALSIAGNLPVWTGLQSSAWTTSTIGGLSNWKLQTALTDTDFLVNDTVLFADTIPGGGAPGTTTVNIPDVGGVAPTTTTFANSSLAYTVTATGGAGITSGVLIKSGNGILNLGGTHSYTGATTLNDGTTNLTGTLGNTAVTVAAPATLSLQGAGAISQNTLTVNGTLTQTVANSLSGTAAVVLNNGASLSVANSHSGGTTLNAGTLNIGTATAIGTGTLTIAGGTVDNTSGSSLTFTNNNPIRLAADLNFTGTNPLNTGTGEVTLGNDASAQTVNIVSGNTLTIGGAVTSGIGGTAGVKTLNISGSDTAFTGNITNGTSAGVDVVSSLGGTLTLSGSANSFRTLRLNSATTNTLNIGAGNFTVSNGGGDILQSTTGGVINGSGALNIGSANGDFGTAGGTTLTINPAITGNAVDFYNNNGGAGFGTIVLNSAANSTAGVNVQNTKLVIPASGVVATSGAFIVADVAATAQLDLNGGTINANRTAAPAFAVAITTGATGTVNMTGGTINVASEFWLSNNPGTSATMNMSAGAVNTNAWFVVGRTGGTGTLNLSGGTITKTGTAANYAIIGSIAGTGTVTQTGGAFNVTAGGIRIGEANGATPALNALWDMQGGTSTVTGEVNVGWRSSEATWNIKPGATVTVNGRLLVASETSNATINTGVIVNGGPVGTVNMTGGTATFTAGDHIIGGSNSAVSVGAKGTVSVSGGTMNFGGNLQIGGYGQGTMNIQGTGTVNSTGGFPVVGRFGGGVGTLTVDAGGTFNQTGVGAALILGEQGTGTMNVYGGGLTDVESLFLGHTTTGNGTVNLIGGTLATKIVQRTDVTTSVAAFNFDGGTLKAKASAANFFPGFTDTQIKVEASGATIDTNGFDVGITQGISDGLTAGGGLTKVGNGKLTLSAAHAFTGATSVNGGTLSLTGSLSGSVAVNNGGTLGGTGTITGAVTANSGATVSPGLSPGQLNTGAFTLNSGASLALEVNATGAGNFDTLNVTGGVTLGGTLSLSGTYLTTPTVTNDLFFGIINDGSDPIIGTFAGVPNGSHVFAPNGQDFIVSYFGHSDGNAVTGGNDFVLQAVPEPGSAALLLGGLAMLAGRRRRSAR